MSELVLDHLRDRASQIHIRDVNQKGVLGINFFQNPSTNVASGTCDFFDCGEREITFLGGNVTNTLFFDFDANIDKVSIFYGPDSSITHIVDFNFLSVNIGGVEHIDFFELWIDFFQWLFLTQHFEELFHRDVDFLLSSGSHSVINLDLKHQTWGGCKLLPFGIGFDLFQFLNGLESDFEKLFVSGFIVHPKDLFNVI